MMLGLILEYNKMLMSIRSLRENLQFKSMIVNIEEDDEF